MLYGHVKASYLTQQAFTCSKSTTETLEKSLTYVQSYQWRYQKDVIEVVLVFSLLTVNYFKSSPSFHLVDFEQVNIYWENYLTFYSSRISFNVSTGGRQDLTRAMQGKFRYFSYFPHSVRCNFCEPSITQIIHSMITGKFVWMRPPIFGDIKIK